MKNVAVVLSGCGVYDGSEIHEAVITLLELSRQGATTHCFAPDKLQLHVINHLKGEEMPESRNVLVESARIARGAVQPLSELNPKEFDAVMFPGGFGAAKNLSTWALSGPDGEIEPETARVIRGCVENKVPLALVCMSPVLVSKALAGSGVSARLTVGTDQAPSPYDIKAISEGMNSLGVHAEMCPVDSFVLDEQNKVITTPAYMMETGIVEVANGISATVKKLLEMA